MIYDFKGKVAMVSGGSQGIGFGCAQHFVRGGASVAIAGRSPSTVEPAVKELEELARSENTGAQVLGVAADLSSGEGSQKFVDETVARFGGVDILVNSAGGSRSAPFLQIPDEYLLEGWTLKLLGGIRLTRAVVPIMEQRGGGSVILLSGGSSGPNPSRVPAWSTNGAQKSFVSAVAQELASRGVAINLVQPGLVQTRRYTIEIERRAKEENADPQELLQKHVNTVPTKHITQPEEIAELIAFLAARRVINLTGHEISCAY